MLDLTPLSPSLLWLSGISFSLAFLITSYFLSSGKPLRIARLNPAVFYAGPVLILIVATISSMLLESLLLKLSLLACAVITILIGGYDEANKLSPSAQLLGQVIIILVLVLSGWSITQVSNPFGPGVLPLTGFKIVNIPYLSIILSVIWLLIIINAINWLDGIDGLASSVSLIALITISAVALLPSTQDRMTLQLALIGAGGIAALAILNFPPAKIFLGTSGSWFIAWYIGITAIIGGGKIATTMLVLALPVADFATVIIRRLLTRQAPWIGDKNNHLHYLLRRLGFSDRAILLLFIIFSACLALSAIILQTNQKIIAFSIAAGMVLLMSIQLWPVEKY